MYALTQSTGITIPFFAHDEAGDPVTGKVTGDWTKRIKKAGAAWAAMTATVTEGEGGWYDLVLDTGHTDTTGLLTLYLTALGVKQVNLQWMVTVAGESGANLTHIDGLATAGNLATLNLKQLNVVNTAGSAIVAHGGGTGHGIQAQGGATSGSGILAVSQTGSTSPGIVAAGDGPGAGLKVQGGATGHGFEALTGGAGNGIKATGGVNNAGLNLVGQGSAAGLLSTGGATGHGVQAVGGATSGNGIRVTGTAGNSSAMSLAGQGSGAGLVAVGGATGHGLSATGGATSGHGINATATAGNGSGLHVVGQGSGNGLTAQAGATGSGLYAVASGANAMAFQAYSPLGYGAWIWGEGGVGIEADMFEGLLISSYGGNGIEVEGGDYGIEVNGGQFGGVGLWAGGVDSPGIEVSGRGTSPAIKARNEDTGPGIEIEAGAGADAIVAIAPSGKALGDSIVDSILNRTGIAEPAGVPTWPQSIGSSLGFVGALARNKIIQTAGLQTVRNAADSADIGSSVHAVVAGTHTREEFS